MVLLTGCETPNNETEIKDNSPKIHEIRLGESVSIEFNVNGQFGKEDYCYTGLTETSIHLVKNCGHMYSYTLLLPRKEPILENPETGETFKVIDYSFNKITIEVK
jgi:hypothetical protein